MLRLRLRLVLLLVLVLVLVLVLRLRLRLPGQCTAEPGLRGSSSSELDSAKQLQLIHLVASYRVTSSYKHVVDLLLAGAPGCKQRVVR